jgi:hypothetical protein
MAKYNVRVGKDARQFFTAMVEADSIQELKSKCGRHGFKSDDSVVWKEDGVIVFDDMETVEVWKEGEDPDDAQVIYEG